MEFATYAQSPSKNGTTHYIEETKMRLTISSPWIPLIAAPLVLLAAMTFKETQPSETIQDATMTARICESSVPALMPPDIAQSGKVKVTELAETGEFSTLIAQAGKARPDTGAVGSLVQYVRCLPAST